jgi:hypothetical protein
MKTFIVSIETRKGDRNATLGPFTTIAKAQEAIHEYLGWPLEKLISYKNYESDFNKGCILTEEVTIQTLERELD